MMQGTSTSARSIVAHRFSVDVFAVLLLVILAVWLFRGHAFGDNLWVGNPDRLNNDLS